MLSNVVAAVVDPISIGMGHSGVLTRGRRRRCNGNRGAAYSRGPWREKWPTLFVARSAKLARWASDVGFGKHSTRSACAEDDPKALAAAGWAGETDWTIVRKTAVEDLSEADALDRLGRKEKMIDPNLYPKLKGAAGVFRLSPERVENHIIVTRALAGQSDRLDLKLKPTDFADYLIYNTLR